jgi:hypothetical protein
MAYSTCAKCGNGNRNTLLPGLRLGSVVMYAAFAAAFACAQSNSFGPLTVPGTAVIFDPDNVVSGARLASVAGRGPFSPRSAVKALSFPAASGQTMTFSAQGLLGCCSVPNVGPDGYPGSRVNINSLGSISGFISQRGLPLSGVFTNGSPSGPAPAPYDYSAGVGQANFYPVLNQVFFIGDGLTGTGSGQQQVFNVPPTATELWLGFPDGGDFQGPPGNYADNVGSILVSGTLVSDCNATSTGSHPITSQTSATVPGVSDSRTCIGVEESVKLITGEPATWTITSSGVPVQLGTNLTAIPSEPQGTGLPSVECQSAGLADQVSGTQACFTAPLYAATITVTATFADNSSSSKTFTVLQPSGILFRRMQSPPNSPDYYLANDGALGFGFTIRMQSVGFVTPGYVSFANIGFSEHDRPDPFFSYKFNSLFNVDGTNAWLLSCDNDKDIVQTFVPGFKQSDWVYAHTQFGTKVAFSTVRTAWIYNPLENFPYGVATYSKGQVAALSTDGSFVSTPNAPVARLRVPGTNHNDLIEFNKDNCLPLVREQFNEVQQPLIAGP